MKSLWDPPQAQTVIMTALRAATTGHRHTELFHTEQQLSGKKSGLPILTKRDGRDRSKSYNNVPARER